VRRNLFEAALLMAQRWREEPLWMLECDLDPPGWPRGSRVMPDGGWEVGDELAGEFEGR
jgi:hypothetical protein